MPFDDGSATVLAFALPGRPDLDLRLHDGGCVSVCNRHISADSTGNLLEQIDNYAPRPRRF